MIHTLGSSGKEGKGTMWGKAERLWDGRKEKQWEGGMEERRTQGREGNAGRCEAWEAQ